VRLPQDRSNRHSSYGQEAGKAFASAIASAAGGEEKRTTRFAPNPDPSYFAYYHRARTHLWPAKDAPTEHEAHRPSGGSVASSRSPGSAAFTIDTSGEQHELNPLLAGTGWSSAARNHYGSRSPRRTEVAALFYSLLESAKLCGVESKAYLVQATWAALETPGPSPSLTRS
jgi:hypothetical protein